VGNSRKINIKHKTKMPNVQIRGAIERCYRKGERDRQKEGEREGREEVIYRCR
jgi:hypothetical protein